MTSSSGTRVDSLNKLEIASHCPVLHCSTYQSARSRVTHAAGRNLLYDDRRAEQTLAAVIAIGALQTSGQPAKTKLTTSSSKACGIPRPWATFPTNDFQHSEQDSGISGLRVQNRKPAERKNKREWNGVVWRMYVSYRTHILKFQ